jgi:hypothetical protein
MMEKLKIPISKLMKTEQLVMGIGNHRSKVIGKVLLEVQVGTKQLAHWFIVAADEGEGLIMGDDLMVRLACWVKYPERLIFVDNSQVTTYTYRRRYMDASFYQGQDQPKEIVPPRKGGVESC